MYKKSIDLQSVSDEGKFGASRIFVFAVCFLILLLDGYDVQAQGAITLAVMRDLQLSPEEFGLVFGLGGAEVLIGAITFGTLGDVYCRKLLLSVYLAIFSGFSVCMATALLDRTRRRCAERHSSSVRIHAEENASIVGAHFVNGATDSVMRALMCG